MTDNGGTGGVQSLQRRHARREGHAVPGRHAGAVVLALAGTFKPGDVDKLTMHTSTSSRRSPSWPARRFRRGDCQVEGRSLVPLLRNPEGGVARSVRVHARRPLGEGQGGGIEVRRLQRPHQPLPHGDSDRQGKRKWELYDMKADPGEKKNIAAENAEAMKPIEAAYDKWWDARSSRAW